MRPAPPAASLPNHHIDDRLLARQGHCVGPLYREHWDGNALQRVRHGVYRRR